jgi:hypothetical protein
MGWPLSIRAARLQGDGMHQISVGRRGLSVVAVIVTGTAAAVLGPVGVARASSPTPVRVTQASVYNMNPQKSATATCTDEEDRVFAAGVRVIGGNGGVVVTSMAPDASTRSVTVTARARTGHQGAWSVLAMAVCDAALAPPVVVAQTEVHSSTANVTCPGTSAVTGVGFSMVGSVDDAFLDGLAFGPALRTVAAHTGGTAPPPALTVLAFCMLMPTFERLAATEDLNGGWPIAATVGNTDPDLRVYGVGALVQSPYPVMLSALVPDVENDSGRAEAVPASVLPGRADTASARARAPLARAGLAGGAGLDDGEGSLSVYATAIGTFH